MNKILSTFCLIILLTSSSFALEVQETNFFKRQDNPIVAAIKLKALEWQAAFKQLANSDKNMIDAISAIDDVRIQQKSIAESTVIEQPLDTGNDLVTKAAQASYWNSANLQKDKFANFLDGAIASKLSLKDTVDESTTKTIDKLVATDKTISDDAEISNPMINAASLFAPRTYGGDTPEDTDVETQLLRANDFAKFAIHAYNRDPVDPEKEGYSKKLEETSRAARISLAFNGLNNIISMRTNVKNGGLGAYIKSHLTKLQEDTGISDFSDVIDNIHDDISKYEFMDDLFTYIYMNPAWYTSLEKLNPASLTRKKAELHAFINMLNWENEKLIEKIVAVSASDLAIKTNK